MGFDFWPRMSERVHSQSTREKADDVPSMEQIATFPLAVYGEDWEMGPPPVSYTTPRNGFLCLIKDTKWCKKWRSNKKLMADHLAQFHSLRMGDPPRGRPPKPGKKPQKRTAQTTLGEEQRSQGNFHLKVWKAKKAKTVSLFLHAASDRSVSIPTIHRDYQKMYYRWRWSDKFQETLRNTRRNVKQYWMKRIEKEPAITWESVKKQVSKLSPFLFAFKFEIQTCTIDL
jgi:hypothetical protein